MDNITTDFITIVLVEDHDLTRIGMKAALQRQPDIQILGEAENGTKGLQLLQISRPTVAIVDIGLPDMDGIELTRRFRATQTTETKILILTMHDSEEAVLAAFAAGADSYCMKDTSTEQLVSAIHVTAAGDNWIDPSIASVILKQTRSTETEAVPSVAIEAIDPEFGHLLQNSPLTVRELDVLRLIVEGCSNEAIGKRLYLTVGTVKTHVRNILNKMCVDDRTQAAVRALRAGLVK
ncbi:MAG: response regulator transcription factor [Timaviella obliquedivisa GSE-PSE-MK23-08B]|jgi:DNA-binding NarL/FixJ family response regulator|nr:response regulator transcription factor [Timaviella obliquedivisa GSE-PSE-MK23-08B]